MKQLLAAIMLFIIFIVLMYRLLFMPSGVLAISPKQEELLKLQERYAFIEESSQELQEYINGVSQDDMLKKSLARKQFMLISEGEVFYRVDKNLLLQQ